jgi:4-diphosphocytidyl-2-C-methyl-D-erythritol kinase
MVVFPPCKINLGLNIVAKRADGYHDIDTCFYPVPWTDLLEILPANELKMKTSGIEIPGSTDENICLKAYHLLARDFKIPTIQIYLHKLIPIGAGLGGGSSDGAFALKTLNSIFDLKLSSDQLRTYAAQLGSDCAFFIDAVPAIGVGRGDVLTPTSVDLGGKFLVIIKPDIHVSTAEAYEKVKPKAWKMPVQKILEDYPVEEWKHHLENDFESSIFDKYPVIKAVKDKMYKAGAIYACMSGSGSSVFGIFDSEVDLESIYRDSSVVGWAGWL